MKKDTLILVLTKKAYEITGTPEKMFELRHRSEWLKSRLHNKDCSMRQYKYIEFRQGYTNVKKTFAFDIAYSRNMNKTYTFSNGLIFEFKPYDCIIEFKNIEK